MDWFLGVSKMQFSQELSLDFYYFCDSRNIIEISRCLLFFSKIFVVIPNNSDIYFGSEYKRENKISQAADDNSFLVRWNERVVIMHSYAELLRWSERVSIFRSPRASLRLHLNANAKLRLRLVVIHIFFSPRRIKGGINWYSDLLCVKYSRTRIKETRIKETFGYKKRFHSSAFMQDKLSTLIGQLIKNMDKRNPILTALCFFYPSLTVMIKQECIGIPDMILLLMKYYYQWILLSIINEAEIIVCSGGAYFHEI